MKNSRRPLGRLRLGVALGDQHVAVREDEEPARMVEAGGEGGHLQAGRGLRRLPRAPAASGGDVHGRNDLQARRGQRRFRSDAGRSREVRVGAAADERNYQDGKNDACSHGAPGLFRKAERPVGRNGSPARSEGWSADRIRPETPSTIIRRPFFVPRGQPRARRRLDHARPTPAGRRRRPERRPRRP